MLKIAGSVPRADLTVFPASISFSPNTPNPNDTVTINTLIFNSGFAVAENVKIGIYNGDPRTNGTLIDQLQNISSIQVNGSTLVTVELNTTTLTEGPVIYVVADPENAIPEVNKANNIAYKLLHINGLPDAVITEDIDLYIAEADISFNNEHTDTVYLIDSSTVMINLNIANLGTQESGEFRITVADGTTSIASLTVPSINAVSQQMINIPWNPSPNSHSLTVTLDSEGVITETNEINNEASTQLEVIGGSANIIVKKYENAVETKPPFNAYDIARFTVLQSSKLSSNSDSLFLIQDIILPHLRSILKKEYPFYPHRGYSP
ncbi:MAG: CARDB domain-containing protein [Verrucomicrobiota bacterium]|nr:CARDB domain-containing protein [Verrucomicrobiota bacterium]